MSYISRTKPLSRIQKRFNSWSIVRKKGSILEDITNRVQFFESFFFWKKMNSLSHNFCLKKSIFRVVLKLGSILWVMVLFFSKKKKSSILWVISEKEFNFWVVPKKEIVQKNQFFDSYYEKFFPILRRKKEFNSLCHFFLKVNSLRHIWKKSPILCVIFKEKGFISVSRNQKKKKKFNSVSRFQKKIQFCESKLKKVQFFVFQKRFNSLGHIEKNSILCEEV